jgi:3-oxoacyl-(acyl-carrier-protein) synthase
MLIDAGMLAGAVVGGTEASVTGFTLAQLKAVKIYSKNIDAAFPCKPMAKDRCGTVIGDGAACLLLEKKPYPNALFAITGFGAATENGVSLTGVSPTGDTLVAAIKQALDSAGLAAQDIAFITGHGTGTVKGDEAEHCAYERVFGATIPPRAFHKWMTGHLLGAAGAFSVALTTKHLEQAFIPGHPYFTELNHPLSVPVKLNNPKHALVSTLGFGGNAGALIISKIG